MERKECIEIAKEIQKEYDGFLAQSIDSKQPEINIKFERERVEALSLLISIAERVDVIKIKDILNTTCLECKSAMQGCLITCSILAYAITQYLEEEEIKERLK